MVGSHRWCHHTLITQPSRLGIIGKNSSVCMATTNQLSATWLEITFCMETMESWISLVTLSSSWTSKMHYRASWEKKKEKNDFNQARGCLLSRWALRTNLGLECLTDDSHSSLTDDHFDVTTFISVRVQPLIHCEHFINWNL